MNEQVIKFFAEKDVKPPPSRVKMAVRMRATRSLGPYTLLLESSCGTGPPRVAGSARLFLYDTRSDDADEPVAVKRFAVDSWREATGELARAVDVLRGKEK